MSASGRFPRLPGPYLGHWLPLAKKSWRGDLIAGITLWGLVVPESIAYAGLAGLPPTSGIWAVIVLLPVYALWGRSRHLVASPTSAIAVTTGGLVLTIGAHQPQQAAAAVTIGVGLTFLFAWLFGLGFLVHFISDPINAGFMFGIAVFVVISQVHKMLGIEGSHGTAVERLISDVQHLGDTKPVVVGLTLLAFALMIGLPRLSKRIPAGLAMIAGLSVLVAGLGLVQRYAVPTPGKIDTGFPSVVLPDLSTADLALVVSGAVGITLVAFSEAAAVARAIAAERGYDYDADHDLFPLGIGNVLSGMIGGIAGAGSMTASAENQEAGAKTQVSTLVAAAAALVTVLFLGAAVAYLPEAALAVLIVVAVRHHLSVGFFPRIARFSRAEARIAALAAAGVLLLGVLNGLLLAMGASMLWFIVRTTRVRSWPLAYSHRDHAALVVSDSPDAEPLPDGICAIRFKGEIFYGNIERVGDQIATLVQGSSNDPLAPEYHAVVINVLDTGFIDYTTARSFRELAIRLQIMGVWVVIVNAHEALRGTLHRFDDIPANVVLLPTSDIRPLVDQLTTTRPPQGLVPFKEQA